ncbi:type I-C CRISPR-associated protein Cas5c [Methanofollis fontis]|uniref:Type I-C CRISPR-associated protein Cas5 n=1 Tax=Methanofollis fontis TaxID=2052832 RepID=A0A483CLT8_9EURY|nr:type I-C CRISPR-associated protein Cas5c [Methanofollis fontis]TAJ43959.1 type I-C CRISPR-associated protein Cas5 [Methanofollis fontis]
MKIHYSLFKEVIAIGFGIKLKVWGDYACFTRPEMKVERVSYDVITPSAARGILEAIYWKPAISWKIDKIHVLNPIRFDNIRRNERPGKISTGKVKTAFKGGDAALYQDSTEDTVQRASLVLRDVCYAIEAHFEMTDRAGPEDTAEKHYNVALRRMRKGQCFHHPYFGCREFPVQFELIEGKVPASCYRGETGGERDLGFMLYDIDFTDDMKAVFFRASMVDGVIDIQKCLCYGGVS